MKSLTETLAMDRAVQKALKMTDSEDTLIVVTADHSHAFTVSGYPERGNDILGHGDNIIDIMLLNLKIEEDPCYDDRISKFKR